MRIRSATDADFDAIISLWDAAGMLAYTPDPDDELRRVRAHEPDLLLVVDVEDTTVGTLLGSFDGRRGWLMRLSVAPDARRNGVGRALVAEAERRFALRGCPQVNLLVFADNAAAQTFWAELGYGTAPPVVLMHRRLDGG